MTWIGINEMILKSLVVAALYLIIYLWFLYLLRKPRLWLPVSMRDKLIGILLLAVLNGYISISGAVVDLWILFISVTGIALLFYIIAAPAYALLPSRPLLVQFIAWNAPRIEIGLLLPALILLFYVSNLKLRALLITTILIESFWYLRLWMKQRYKKAKTLDEHSLLVLKAQANSDIKRFAKKRHIPELQIVQEQISWLGCTQQSFPCPMDYYVNTLGLNTPPCCLDNMLEMLHRIDSDLAKIGVLHWIEGGTLLGAVRENGNLLAWEDDADISFLLTEENTWQKMVASIKKIARHAHYQVIVFEKIESIYIYYDPPGPWPFNYERTRMRGEIRIDMHGYRVSRSSGNNVVERFTSKGLLQKNRKGKFEMPLELVLPLSVISFAGRKVSCPAKSGDYLEAMYGNYTEVEYTWIENDSANVRRQIDQKR